MRANSLKPVSLAMPGNPWASWAQRCPGPTAEVTATLVLGGAFLLRMDSLTQCITALPVGMVHPDRALGFYPPVRMPGPTEVA